MNSGLPDLRACTLNTTTLPKLLGEPGILGVCVREEERVWPVEGGADSPGEGQQVKSEAQMTVGSAPGRQGRGGFPWERTV